MEDRFKYVFMNTFCFSLALWSQIYSIYQCFYHLRSEAKSLPHPSHPSTIFICFSLSFSHVHSSPLYSFIGSVFPEIQPSLWKDRTEMRKLDKLKRDKGPPLPLPSLFHSSSHFHRCGGNSISGWSREKRNAQGAGPSSSVYSNNGWEDAQSEDCE